ncbi:BCCT family transporter [Coxiella burnetii]|uniref:Glycine betaine transporter n=2 Tax=Coxiella burnetii TaxID=777 RepID=Q83B69_COXBU|nr:BCCT family transporter [Coxiella burnetii]NP_820628.1 glycine betaine transporter [Coxiella burnetii RSA 493]AAO91142.1 glycine betaine transporter [Coxiella burnetii RSA 493]ABS78107.1 glycine betaine transporter [Coxiella burnetii Dugway 5J108-111]ACJ17808.1 glycine betaine transporter [Coxiella burnetii CbuG_Q212]ARI66403.1 transporter [Coxiella burnetii]ARK27856.1 transporter [Coxiella burnetii]
MKTFQARYKLLFPLVLSGVIATIVLSYWFLPAVLAFYKVYWLFIFVAAIVVLTPLGNRRLGEMPPSKKLPHWILQVLIFEISLLAVFWGICVLVGLKMPLFSEAQPQLFTQTLSYLSTQLGIFSWAAIAVIACAMGTVSYRQQQDAYLSTTLRPLLRTQPNSAFELIVNALPRTATLFAFSGTFALYVLLIAGILVPQPLSSLTGLSLLSGIFFFLLVILTTNNFIKRKIYLFTINIRMPLLFRLICFLLLLTLLVIVLSLFLGSTFEKRPSMPGVVHAFLRHGWISNWRLFAIFWWLSWTPITAIFIAKLSRGRSLRSIILTVCALPMVLGILSYNDYLPLDKIPIWLSIVIALMGLFIFLAIISPDYAFDSIMQTYLPKPGVIKYRASDRFLINIFQFSALMICIYLATGIVLLGLLFFIFMLLLSVMLPAISAILLKKNTH